MTILNEQDNSEQQEEAVTPLAVSLRKASPTEATDDDAELGSPVQKPQLKFARSCRHVTPATKDNPVPPSDGASAVAVCAPPAQPERPAERPAEPENSREETAEFAFKPAVLAVTSSCDRSYKQARRELFRPTPEQVRGARAWLVRVVARRAVEILRAQETAP